MKSAEEMAEEIVVLVYNRIDNNGEWDRRNLALEEVAQTLTSFAEEREREVLRAAKFWSDIDVDGKAFDIEQAKLELVDYHFLLEQIPTVYDNVTGGLLSKPLYPAGIVVDAFQDFLSRERDEAAEEARAEALEEAAKVADEHANELSHDSVSKYLNDIPQETANRIRALKEKP